MMVKHVFYKMRFLGVKIRLLQGEARKSTNIDLLSYPILDLGQPTPVKFISSRI